MASWSDVGSTVDWTWDSSLAVPGLAYRWTISATGARPVAGTFGASSRRSRSPSSRSVRRFSPARPAARVGVLQAERSCDRDRRPGRPAREVGGRGLIGAGPAGRSRSSTRPETCRTGATRLRVSAPRRDREVGARCGAADREPRPVRSRRTRRSCRRTATAAATRSPSASRLRRPAVATLSLVGPEATFSLFSGQLPPGPQSFTFTGTAADGSPFPTASTRRRRGRRGQVRPAADDRQHGAGADARLDRRRSSSRLRAGDRDRDGERQADQGEQAGGRVPAGEGRDGQDANVVVRDAAGNESLPVTIRRDGALTQRS